MDVDVSGTGERVATRGRRLTELEHVALEAEAPRHREEEGGRQQREVALRVGGRAKWPQRQRASLEVDEHRGRDRDRDEPEEQARRLQLEREREDEEPDVLAGH